MSFAISQEEASPQAMKAKGPGQSALLLLDVIDILEHFRIPYAVIGAVAASFHGVVRASLDADALISFEPSQVDAKRLTGELQKTGFKSRHRKGDFDDPIGAVINVEDRFHNRVDLLMDIHGMSEAVFSRTVEATFMDARIRVVGLEDFIAMKIFAGSPKDLHDAGGVFKVSRDRINLALLKRLVQQYGKGALQTLQSLLQERQP